MAKPFLFILLKDTGVQKIVEHTSYDRFWGDGGDGNGQNELGKILENLRGWTFCFSPWSWTNSYSHPEVDSEISLWDELGKSERVVGKEGFLYEVWRTEKNLYLKSLNQCIENLEKHEQAPLESYDKLAWEKNY